jgi:hypothetical protein
MKSLYFSIFLLGTVAIASYFARAIGWYTDYWFTDVVLHTLSGVMFGSFWLWYMNKENIRNKWVVFFSIITFAVFGSVAWEFWEFSGWKITPSHTQFYIPELDDSLNDILCGMLGSMIVSIYSYIRINK